MICPLYPYPSIYPLLDGLPIYIPNTLILKTSYSQSLGYRIIYYIMIGYFFKIDSSILLGNNYTFISCFYNSL